MKVLGILCLIVAATMAAPSSSSVSVLSNEATVDPDGKYHYHFELDDGTKTTQDGVLKHVNSERDGEAIEGKFSFIADDGQQYAISYTADEHGYQPVGAHLPTPPPIPDHVLKAIKYIEEHPYIPPPFRTAAKHN